MSALKDIATIAPTRIWDGVLARVVEGARITLAVVELEPGSNVPEHAHDNEQLGIVLKGSIRFTVAGETRELGPGGTWRILSNVPHAAQAGPNGATVIDVFAPVRSDWDGLPRLEPRSPLWPDV